MYSMQISQLNFIVEPCIDITINTGRIQCNLEYELRNWELKYKSAQAESMLNLKALMTVVTTPY